MSHAPSEPSPHAGGLLAIQRVTAFEHRGLSLASPALGPDGRLSEASAADHDDASPALSWTPVLEAAAYALIVEDPDAPGDAPFLHWAVWNIPGGESALPAGVPRLERPPELKGAVQGRNSKGEIGWTGFAPPVGGGAHRYHFQLFALSGDLPHLGAETPLETLVNALKGLTLASGEIVGLYERADPVLDAPSPGRTGGYGADPHSPTRAERASGRAGLDDDDRDRHAPHRPDGEVRRP